TSCRATPGAQAERPVAAGCLVTGRDWGLHPEASPQRTAREFPCMKVVPYQEAAGEVIRVGGNPYSFDRATRPQRDTKNPENAQSPRPESLDRIAVAGSETSTSGDRNLAPGQDSRQAVTSWQGTCSY